MVNLPNLQGTSLYLIGMMGSGKTTIGKLLADRLKYQFFDTDQLIEQVTNQTVTQLFSDLGEAAFRQLETQMLAELSSYTRKLISTGGGVVTKPDNWGHLRTGVMIWLDVPIEVLHARLLSDTTRPLLGTVTNSTTSLTTDHTTNLKTKLESLLIDREMLYAQSDIRIAIASEETPDMICDRILGALAEACEAKASAQEHIRKLNEAMPFQLDR